MAAVGRIIAPGHLEATKTTALFIMEGVIKAINMASTVRFRRGESLPSAWPV